MTPEEFARYRSKHKRTTLILCVLFAVFLIIGLYAIA